MKNLNSLFLFGILFFFSTNSFAQHSNISANLWTPISPQDHSRSFAERQIKTKKEKLLHLKINSIKEKLYAITNSAQISNNTITLPLPNGRFARFTIKESALMADGLKKKFPKIRTFTGHGIDDKTATLKLDINSNTFHAMIISAGHSIYIDPIYKDDPSIYSSYYKRDFIKNNTSPFIEKLDRNGANKKDAILYNNKNAMIETDGKLRVYRLAVSTTIGFTNFYGGTVEGTLAGIVNVMNRVSGVYERDVAVSFQLVENNDKIIVTENTNNPFTNDNNIFSDNRNFINTNIGSANYDIGHIMTLGDGGFAGLGVVCDNSSKSNGLTGLDEPIGDPYAIDYVAHEMGHQFNAEHTFNGSVGSCDGNGANRTSYEPGSGTTIMAYAGLCGSQNTAFKSSDYFHSISLDEIYTFVSEGSGTCGTVTETENIAPVVDAGPGGMNIPIRTPFSISGSATDANESDSLTYCWEQFDLGPFGSPNQPEGTAPLFRSFPPSANSTRTFPRLSDILENKQTIGELLPRKSRELNFRLTVRDNNAIAGAVGHADMTINVTSKAGPFFIKEETEMTPVIANADYPLLWEVANTDQAPVNAAMVNILLSLDGGMSFPIVLLENTPNDGNAIVSIPDTTTSSARFKIEAADNIFFDLSNNNFPITSMVSPTIRTRLVQEAGFVCPSNEFSTTLQITSIGEEIDSIKLSAPNIPEGVEISFSPTKVVSGETVRITVKNINAQNLEAFDLKIVAKSGRFKTSNILKMDFLDGVPNKADLTLPIDGTDDLAAAGFRFDWESVTAAKTYTFELSEDPDFNSLKVEVENINNSNFVNQTPLAGCSNYYWRVKAVNECGEGAYSESFAFSTATNTHIIQKYEGEAIVIKSGQANTISSRIEIEQNVPISDINVVDLKGVHSWVGDLRISLISPRGKRVTLFESICDDGFQNFDLILDDEATLSNIVCPPTGGKTYKPLEPLSAFIGDKSKGKWTLQIDDQVDDDGGQLISWGLEIIANETALTTPKDLAATAISDTTIQLSWLAMEGIAYEIQQSIDGVNFETVGTTETAANSFDVNGLQAAQTYQFRIKAVQSSAFSCFSSIVEATTLMTGSNYIYLENVISLFPNPVKDQLNIVIKTEVMGLHQLKLIDLSGRVLRTIAFDKKQSRVKVPISFSEIPAGIYFIEMSSAEYFSSAKVVKN